MVPNERLENLAPIVPSSPLFSLPSAPVPLRLCLPTSVPQYQWLVSPCPLVNLRLHLRNGALCKGNPELALRTPHYCPAPTRTVPSDTALHGQQAVNAALKTSQTRPHLNTNLFTFSKSKRNFILPHSSFKWVISSCYHPSRPFPRRQWVSCAHSSAGTRRCSCCSHQAVTMRFGYQNVNTKNRNKNISNSIPKL